MQLQDGNEVPDGSDDGEAQDRVDPWVLPCAVGEALVLQSRSQESRRSLIKEVGVVIYFKDS